jgi:hypothetical protein
LCEVLGGGQGCIPTTQPHLSTHFSLAPHTLACSDSIHCTKNHICYYQDRHGHHASLMATHFKNDSLKGDQELPLSTSMLKPLTLLERATQASKPNSSLLFCDHLGEPYKGPYFSMVCSKAISVGGIHLTANDVRHMFVTLWRDFLNHPSTKLIDLTIQQMSASAADLMLNTTAAWNLAYDDTTRNRAIHTTLSLWPKFVEFVHEAHLDALSKKEWNPLTIDIDTLPT